MRFMIIRKADKDTEAGVMPKEELLEAMATYNESLIKAGMMLDGMGLQPSSAGARIKFHQGKPVVTDGPFAETKELLAGFTLIQANSKEEAIEWVKRWPAQDANGEVELELRRVYEMEDFEPGDAIEHHKDNLTQMTRPQVQTNPYLLFKGNCREAFDYYQQVLGGKIEMLITGAETPTKDQLPPDMHDKIMHVRLNLGFTLLMGSDCAPDQFEPNQGISVNITVDTPEEAERIFNALADNGEVGMPMATTFWARRFGMTADQFGIRWMVNCE